LILPRRIYDLGLSHKAVAVYCYLANCADKNGECYPSVRRIAEDLSINKSTVFLNCPQKVRQRYQRKLMQSD